MPALRPKTRACLPVLALLAMSIAARTAVAQPAPVPAPGPQEAVPQPVKTQPALKLAGLVTFVANACPKLQPNYPRFLEVLGALGLAKADLDKPEVRSGYLAYAARYDSDVKSNCARADAQFGQHGSTLAGIFDPR